MTIHCLLGSKKVLCVRPGPIDYLARQGTFILTCPMSNGPGKLSANQIRKRQTWTCSGQAKFESCLSKQRAGIQVFLSPVFGTFFWFLAQLLISAYRFMVVVECRLGKCLFCSFLGQFMVWYTMPWSSLWRWIKSSSMNAHKNINKKNRGIALVKNNLTRSLRGFLWAGS